MPHKRKLILIAKHITILIKRYYLDTNCNDSNFFINKRKYTKIYANLCLNVIRYKNDNKLRHKLLNVTISFSPFLARDLWVIACIRTEIPPCNLILLVKAQQNLMLQRNKWPLCPFLRHAHTRRYMKLYIRIRIPGVLWKI